jgi:hypothetical protein
MQGALWLELRAARGYANLVAGSGRTAEAHRTLQPVVARLTEGHDTLDYMHADALLKTLEE